jgi:hypothetical protein
MDILLAQPASSAPEGQDLQPSAWRYAPDAKDPKAQRAVVEYAALGGLSAGPLPFTGLTESGDPGLVCAPVRCFVVFPGEWLPEEPMGCAAGDPSLRRYAAAGPEEEGPSESPAAG